MSWTHRTYDWLDQRLGISSVILPIIEHKVPKTNLWYVLGSATLIAFIVQVVTGVALAMSYVPAPNSAYDSLQFITHQAVLGSLIRGIHYFGASAMVVLIAAHAVHVFLIASYKYPRELNWFTGVVLLFLTLGAAFTGQLLRWDQSAYWAVVVMAEQVGKTPFVGQQLAELVVAGQTVGGATLTRFYATHVFLLPALIFLVLATHLYLVINLGVSEMPVAGVPVDPKSYQQRYHKLLESEGVPFFPDFAWKDVLFALVVGVVVFALAAIVGPPALGQLADPTVIQADPRPDWYFLWYFALLALVPSSIEDVFILGFPLSVAVILLILPFVANQGERAPSRRPWSVAIVVIAGLSIAILVRQGDLAPWSPTPESAPVPASVTAGLSPAAQRGALVYQTKGCNRCHAVGGVGGQKGPDLSHVGARLNQSQLISRILAGGNGMPAYASNITSAELADLVDFLQSLK
jgi:ubiquinol-cytochrome c reductase cytochrome b subunit